jgi:virginiamycin B lyase
VTTAGKFTIHRSKFVNGRAIAVGPDANLWVADTGLTGKTGNIARITPAGKFTIFGGRGIDRPIAITAGPDDAMWFTNSGSDSIGRITTSATS